MTSILTIFLLGIFSFAILVSLPIQAKLFRYLKDRYPELYIKLGSPAMLTFGKYGYASQNFWSFMILRRHRSLHDPLLSRLFDVLLSLSIITVVALISLAFVPDMLGGHAA